MGHEMILKTLHLTKKIRERMELENISITITEGKITGIIGAENSGKTTLLKILGGRMNPDQGTIEIMEKPASRKSFNLISYLSEGDILPGFYNGKNLAQFFYGYFPDFNTEKFKNYAETLKINLTKKVTTLSPQKKELLKVILCLSRETNIYLLDNPFMMLDSVHLDLLTTVIYSSIDATKGFIITTRDPSLLELVCDDFFDFILGKVHFLWRWRRF
jgi:ABC-2 type transport system ATP-binding protein